MDTNKISQRTVLESVAVAQYLEDLAKAIREGKIVISKDHETLTMGPPAKAQVELKAKKKKGHCTFALKMGWVEADPADAPIIIGSEPAAATKVVAKTNNAVATKPEAKTPVVKEASKTPAVKEAAKTPANRTASEVATTAPEKPGTDKPSKPAARKAPAKKATAAKTGAKKAAPRGAAAPAAASKN